jgi:hypothetical protein
MGTGQKAYSVKVEEDAITTFNYSLLARAD